MKRKVLDTSMLITHWRNQCGGSVRGVTVADVEAWGRELAELRESDAIVTPVYLEFIGGVRSQHELRLARAYLAQFHILDDGQVLAEDWEVARQLAERVPRNCRPRHLGDCLIRAIAKRFNRDVDTFDADFPR